MTVGKKIATGFGATMAILVIIGFFSYRSTAKFIETSGMVAHTHKVLGRLRNLLAAILDAETSQRGYIITGSLPFLEPYKHAKVEAGRELQELRALTSDNARQKPHLDALEALMAARFAALDKHAAMREDFKTMEPIAESIRKSNANQVMGDIRKEIVAMESEEERLLKIRDDEAQASGQNTYWTIGLGTALALVCGGGFFLVRSITVPLREAVGQLASGSAELLATTAEQAAGAQEQAAAVAETVTTVDEVAQTAEQSAQRVRGVGEAVQRTTEVGKAGRRAVEDSLRATGAVKEQVEATAESILTLAEQAQAIGEIIATVNDIAEQTNLLALNAAIEASRAGEHGRGFAVVASEVKALADQSKKATAQVRQILGEVQKATNAAVLSTEDVTRGVAEALKVGEQAGEAIKALAETLAEAARAAAQIVASVGQQAAGMGQIHQAMKNIDQVAKQNAVATRQAAQVAEGLNTLGARLTRLISG